MGNLEQFLFDVAAPSAWLELGGLVACVLVAGFLTRWWGRGADRDSILFGQNIIDGLLFPILALLMVSVLKLHWLKTHHAPWLGLAVPVLASLAMVRLIARVLSVVFPQSKGARAVERGVFWLVWGVAVLWITGVAEPVLQEIDDIQIVVGKNHFTLLHALQATLASGVAMIMTLWLSAVLEQKLLARAITDLSMRKVATNALRVLLLGVGGIVVLSLLGVDLTALSVMGGAVGVGLGFGLQKLAANYVSGFVLLLERSVRIGDYVRVETVEGRVTDIKTRFTLIQAINGSEAVVPNETMMTQLVENLSLQSAHFQLSCFYLLAQNSPVAQTQALLIQAAQSVPEVLVEPAPSALLQEVSPLGLRFQVYFWIQDASKGQGVARSKVNMAVLDALQSAGIELAQAPAQTAWWATKGPHQ